MHLRLVAALLPIASALIGKHGCEQAMNGNAVSASPPAPTPAPSNAELRRALEIRQNSLATCGFVSGRQNDLFTCNAASECVFNSIYSNFGCCSTGGDISSCAFQTSCFASAYSSLYTADNYNLGCTDSVNAHCQTYYIQLAGNVLGGYTSYGCGPTALSVSLKQTWISGTVTAAGFTTAVFPAENTATSTPSSAATGSGSSGGSSSGTSTSSASLAPSSAPATSTSSLTPDAGSSTSSSAFNTPIGGTSLSTGAIVGIAVGGFAVLIILLTFLFRCVSAYRRRKRMFNQSQAPARYGGGGHPPSAPPPSSQPWHNNAPSQVGTATAVSSVAPSKMTQANMNAHLGRNEWGFAQSPVPQRQAAAVPTDGIHVTEIYPDEAIDERYAGQMPGSVVGSQAPLTAVAPTAFSHHVQGV